MKITKAILTGGGRATRLRPITTTINKHLIPLGGEPMIFNAIKKAVEAGIKEIFINTNPGETELQRVVGDGSHWGIKIKYFEQTGGPQGIAHVVKCAEQFIGDDPFMFYLSDNIIWGSLIPAFEKFDRDSCDCLLSLAKVNDPERFGVPVFDGEKLVDVLEKPQNPPNDFAITGIYLYGPKVFFEAFDKISKSPRGEYEISSIHSYFLKNNFKVEWQEVTGWWKDTGKPEDLILANNFLLEQTPPEDYIVQSSGAKISGPVAIGKRVKIGEGVDIIGPVVIGDKCLLSNCTIGPFVTVGAGTVVEGSSVKNSIIFAGCTIKTNQKITDSLIGQGAKIISANHQFRRLIVGDFTLIEN